MKKTLFLMSLAVGAVLPVVAHADAPSTKNVKVTRTASAKPVKVSSSKTVYYIAQEPRTGSYIPAVYRRYNGYIDSASSPAIYGQSAIQATGALDVGATLNRLDPSISLRSHG